VPLPIDPNRNLRTFDNQFIKRDLAPQQRNDVQAHIHPVGMKEGRHVRGFKAVHGEIIDFESELPDIHVKRPDIDPRSGALLDATHDFPAHPPLRESRFQNRGRDKDDERNEDQRDR
jgi:hypothetical protein